MHPWWDERVGPVSLMRWITFRPLFVRQKYLIVVIIRKYLDTVIVTTSGQPATPHQLPQTFGLQVIRPIIGDFPINPSPSPLLIPSQNYIIYTLYLLFKLFFKIFMTQFETCQWYYLYFVWKLSHEDKNVRKISVMDLKYPYVSP